MLQFLRTEIEPLANQYGFEPLVQEAYTTIQNHSPGAEAIAFPTNQLFLFDDLHHFIKRYSNETGKWSVVFYAPNIGYNAGRVASKDSLYVFGGMVARGLAQNEVSRLLYLYSEYITVTILPKFLLTSIILILFNPVP